MSLSMNTCAQILQSQPICACGRMMQNCQTLLRGPMIAPSVCAEGWICLFANLLRVVNAFVFPSVLLCRFEGMELRTIPAHQETSAKYKHEHCRVFGFVNRPTRQSCQ